MLLKNIYLLDGKPLQTTVDIRIEENKIKEIGANLEAAAREDTVNGNGAIALPGLVDSHRHVWQAPFQSYASNMMLMDYLNNAVGGLGSQLSAEALYTINLYGYLKAAANGVTTVFDWCHAINSPEHADAAIQAAFDSPINVLFFHSTTAKDREAWWYNSQLSHDKDIIRLAQKYNTTSSCVKIGMGIRGPEFASIDVTREDIELARSLGLPVSMHIGSSILGKIHQPVKQLAETGLLGSDLNLVHCNVLSDNEFSLIEEAGCLVSSTPEVELQMGLGTPIAQQIVDREKLKWSIGLDIVTSSSDNLLQQQQLLLQLYRGTKNQRLIDATILPTDISYTTTDWFYDSMKHAASFARCSTSEKIAVNAQANIVLFDWSHLEETFFRQYPSYHYLHPKDITTVVANGQLLIEKREWKQAKLEVLNEKVAALTKQLLGNR